MSQLFTQRHYQAIAALINKLSLDVEACDCCGDGLLSRRDVAHAFNNLFVDDNPRYKASLFYFAAGFEDVAAQLKKLKHK